MVPEDMMEGLMQGGGGAQAAPEGGGLPPDIMALLGGGGPGAEAGLPPEAEAPAEPTSNVDYLEDAIESLQQYIDGEDDQINVQTALQCQTKLQGILADEQKMQDGLMGGKMDPRAIRKATAGAA